MVSVVARAEKLDSDIANGVGVRDGAWKGGWDYECSQSQSQAVTGRWWGNWYGTAQTMRNDTATWGQSYDQYHRWQTGSWFGGRY